MLFPASFVLTFLAKREVMAVVLFELVGVAMGTIVDAFSDDKDRNMFPIEIVWWWVLFSPAVLAGSVAGWFAQRMRHKKPLEPMQ